MGEMSILFLYTSVTPLGEEARIIPDCQTPYETHYKQYKGVKRQ